MLSTSDNQNEPSFFDRLGERISLKRCVELHGDLDYRILARDEATAGNELVVVTAWLGLDQALGDEDLPMIFGTVALGADGQLWEGQERLAATEGEALVNHMTVLTELSGPQIARSRPEALTLGLAAQAPGEEPAPGPQVRLPDQPE